MTPKDWSTQEEAIAAAKAEILAAIGDTDARLELGTVKNVQRGFVEVNSEEAVTIQIAPVNVSKSYVVLSGYTVAGSSNHVLPWIAEFESTYFVVQGHSKSGAYSNYMKFSWQGIEFY